MQTDPLAQFLDDLRRAVLGTLPDSSSGTVTVHFLADSDPSPDPSRSGGFVFRPARAGEAGAHTLTLRLGPGVVEPAPPPLKAPVAEPLGAEAASGGDAETVRRRLELVLGGPPGFGTGARAEILSDLLLEFGRATIVEEIRSGWISQFDTGADSSASVLKVPPPPPSGG